MNLYGFERCRATVTVIDWTTSPRRIRPCGRWSSLTIAGPPLLRSSRPVPRTLPRPMLSTCRRRVARSGCPPTATSFHRSASATWPISTSFPMTFSHRRVWTSKYSSATGSWSTSGTASRRSAFPTSFPCSEVRPQPTTPICSSPDCLVSVRTTGR